MSAFEELEKEGIITKKQLKQFQIKAKTIAQRLKLQRTVNDQLARTIFRKHYRDNGRHWDTKSNREAFRRLMANRHALHERIARLVPEKIEPEWDSE